MVFRRGQRGGLRVYGRLFFTNIGMWREANYYRATALRAAAAKEIRVFGLGRWLSDHYRQLQTTRLKAGWAERRRIYFAPYLVYTAFGFVVA